MHGPVAKSQSKVGIGPVAAAAAAAAIYAAAMIVTTVDDADMLAPADRIERDAARLERLHQPPPWLVMVRAICCTPIVLRDSDRALLFCDRLASAMRHPSREIDAREYPWVNQFAGRRFHWHWRVREAYRLAPRDAAALCDGLFSADI